MENIRQTIERAWDDRSMLSDGGVNRLFGGKGGHRPFGQRFSEGRGTMSRRFVESERMG